MLNAAGRRADHPPGAGISAGRIERVRLPLLSELLETEIGNKRCVWADLGGAQSGLIAHLSQTPSRLIVADLPAALDAGEESWHRPDAGPILSDAFQAEPVDCVLCWDLLNYMHPGQLKELSSAIKRLADRVCRMHALIHYSGTRMNAVPRRSVLDLDRDLNLKLDTPATDAPDIPAPRFSPKALEKAMPELCVQRTMLLNNGMQEFLFGLR